MRPPLVANAHRPSSPRDDGHFDRTTRIIRPSRMKIGIEATRIPSTPSAQGSRFLELLTSGGGLEWDVLIGKGIVEQSKRREWLWTEPMENDWSVFYIGYNLLVIYMWIYLPLSAYFERNTYANFKQKKDKSIGYNFCFFSYYSSFETVS